MDKTIGDRPGHRAALVAGNLIVAVMITRWVAGAFSFKQTKVERVFAQHPIQMVHGEDQSAPVAGEPINQRRRPGPAEHLKTVAHVRGKKAVGLTLRLFAQTERVVRLTGAKGEVISEGTSDPWNKRIVRCSQSEGGQRASRQLAESSKGPAQATRCCLLGEEAFGHSASFVQVSGLASHSMKFKRAQQKMRTAPIRLPFRGITPEAKGRVQIVVGAISLTEQTGQPRPGADKQRRIAFARLDDRIILGADHVVGVRVRSGPLGPSAARTLLDVVAQSAASRDF